MLDFDNLTAIDVITGGKTITLTEVEVIKGGVATTVWRAEEYIYQSGTLLSGVSLDGFTNTGNTLYRNIEADHYSDGDPVGWYSEKTGWGTISGIDMTDYSKMDINLTYNASVGHGDAYFQYGIDGLTNMNDTGNRDVTTTFTFDISGLTGAHALQFYLYARNESSEPTWGAGVTLNISSIRLYN